jgi:UDP-glucuronate 4-epimerase
VKVLVTGVAGFIGYHLACRLVDQGHEVLGIDNLNHYYDVQLKLDRLRELGVVTTETGSEGTGPVDAKESGLRFLRLDVVDQERVVALFSEERFDAVCHLAAQAGVRYSLTDPWSYLTNNLHGFLSILEAARTHPVRHLVYASSSSVYGLDRSVPFGESGAADHPVSLYAASKRSNELMAHSYSHLFGIPTTGLRFFTVYGPWGRPDMALFTFTKAMLRRDTFDLFNHGDMRRDYTYVDDIVDGVVRVLDRPPRGVAGWDGRQSSVSPAPARVYNVGHGCPTALQDLVAALEDELGVKARTRRVPIQPGEVVSTWADCTALREEIGFEARTPIREGVKHFVAWYRRYYDV